MDAERRERVAACVQRLRAEQADAPSGRLAAGLVAQHAELVGVSRATMYRYLNNGMPSTDRRQGWTWGLRERPALQVAGGNVVEARRLLEEDPDYDRSLPGIRWMQFCARRDLPADELAFYALGTAAAKQHRIVTQVEAACRNELWLADHFQFTVYATPPRGKPARPWATLIMDAYSRRIQGVALSLRPSQAHVLAALRTAIATGGTPMTLAFDRGLEFTADAITQAANDLVFGAVATRAYHPEHKGKVERLVKTLKRRTDRHFPHRAGAAMTLDKKPILTVRDEQGEPVAAPPLDALAAVLFAEVGAYNRAVHSTLHASPEDVYTSDATPIRHVPEWHLRRFLLKEGSRCIREGGLRFRNEWYYAEEFDGHRGNLKVEIRFRQDDLTRLEVFKPDGSWWCTARVHDRASPESHEAVLAHRRFRAANQAKVTRRARKLAKRNYAAVVEAHPSRETTVISRATAESELRQAPSRMASALQTLGHATPDGGDSA